MSNGTEQRKLAAIMFTDMVGYSALAQRNEALALELLEEHRSLLRGLFPKHQGTEIKTTGDGFLVEFASALAAVRCAIEIQRSLATRNVASAGERQLQVRIGIHVGDVVHHEGDVLGDGVNIASRIEPLAGPGGICISVDVERQIRNAIETSLVKLGPTELKNIQMPMELYRVLLPWQQPAPTVAKPASPIQPKGNPRALAVGLGVALVLGTLGWLVYEQVARRTPSNKSSASAPTAAGPIATDKSVAVLPFANMSADKADEYLSDGISEEIITALSKIKGLKVPARTSSFAFKGKNEDIQKIGQRLRVSTVLEGSISKVGNKLRVTAQLISIADGFHLWSETYDRALDDLLAIRTEVAAHVAEALKGQLLGEEKQQLTKRGTDNAEAHRLYLQGRYLWNRRTGEGLKKAVEQFNEAIGKDPSYALAYAGLADCYVVLSEYAGIPTRETMPKARAAALKALELDDGLAEPHAALAVVKTVFDWNWSGAESEFRQAIALNPNYATAYHWLVVQVLCPLLRLDEALVEIKRAQELDPLSPVINANVGDKLSLVGQDDLGIQVLQKQIAIDPSFLLVRWQLGRAYFSIGKFPEAIAELETMHRLDGSGTYGLESLGFVYARVGRTSDGQKVLDQMQELQRQGYDKRVGIALVQHALGDDERALDSLDLAFAERAFGLERVNYYPFWKDLRPHPRVQAILKRMNLVK